MVAKLITHALSHGFDWLPCSPLVMMMLVYVAV